MKKKQQQYRYITPVKRSRNIPGNAPISIATLFDSNEKCHLSSEFKIDDSSIFTKSPAIVCENNQCYNLFLNRSSFGPKVFHIHNGSNAWNVNRRSLNILHSNSHVAFVKQNDSPNAPKCPSLTIREVVTSDQDYYPNASSIGFNFNNYEEKAKIRWKDTTVTKLKPYVPYERKRVNYLHQQRDRLQRERRLRYRTLWKKAFCHIQQDFYQRRVHIREIVCAAAKYLISWHHKERNSLVKDQYNELCTEFSRVLATDWGNVQMQRNNVSHIIESVAKRHTENRIKEWKETLVAEKEAETLRKKELELERARSYLVKWSKSRISLDSDLDKDGKQISAQHKKMRFAVSSIVKNNRKLLQTKSNTSSAGVME